jgi:hypothetical protein
MAKKKKDAIPEDQMTEMAQDFFQEAVKDLVSVRFAVWSDEYGPGLLLSEAIEGIEGYTIENVKCVNVTRLGDETVSVRGNEKPSEKAYVVFLKAKKRK